MMIYDELRKIAQPHIRENDNLPSNALLLLTQLHIPYKTEKQCEKDFKGKYNPLDNHPAFLFVKESEKILYFKTTTRYYNFYIFHELAHYILGHENDSPQNEIDADMLACILAAPIENFPSNIKSARDLSVTCQIPIDKAEMYWQEIKDDFSKWHKKIWMIGCAISVVILSIMLLCIKGCSSTSQNIKKTDTIITPILNSNNQDDLFYISSSGTHYHLNDCKHIKYKNNIIHISKEEADRLNLDPCEDCIK